MTNLLAIVGSPRKKKATDTLVDRAIEGVVSKEPLCKVRKVNLIEYDIKHCRNCLACRDSRTDTPFAKCGIRDDMDYLNEDILKSDILIFGTPVHMGFATALMTSFLERICWTFAQPTKSYLILNKCPEPRSIKQRKAVIIVTSGIVPTMLRWTCDQATKLIKQVAKDSLNAKTVGHMYAGNIENRGVSHYLDKSFDLGKKLV